MCLNCSWKGSSSIVAHMQQTVRPSLSRAWLAGRPAAQVAVLACIRDAHIVPNTVERGGNSGRGEHGPARFQSVSVETAWTEEEQLANRKKTQRSAAGCSEGMDVYNKDFVQTLNTVLLCIFLTMPLAMIEFVDQKTLIRVVFGTRLFCHWGEMSQLPTDSHSPAEIQWTRCGISTDQAFPNSTTDALFHALILYLLYPADTQWH